LPNTGEHKDEELLGTLMAAWQDGAIPDIKTALRDTAEKVDVIVARNQLD
jgi:hypothetical protein